MRCWAFLLGSGSITSDLASCISCREMLVVDLFLGVVNGWVNRIHQAELVLFMLLSLPEMMLSEVL